MFYMIINKLIQNINQNKAKNSHVFNNHIKININAFIIIIIDNA